MTRFHRRPRLALAALCAAAAFGSAAPAQADDRGVDCDARLDNLIAQFYDMADRRSYEEATEWWPARWHAYWLSCVQH